MVSTTRRTRRGVARGMSYNPFPAPYRIFFTIVEPLLTMFGVVYSVATPVTYHQNLVPLTVARFVAREEIHPASIMSVRQLGSCFFLLALLATFLLRRLRTVLLLSTPSQPHLFEPILHTYLLCLAIADVTHVGLTFYELGYAGTMRWWEWNTLVLGNCAITAGLFIWRCAWFTGLGRQNLVGYDGYQVKSE